MRVIFFNNPIGTKKISMVNTNDSVSELIAKEVIPKESKYIIKNYDTDDIESIEMPERIKIIFIEHTYFDNYEDPKEILFDFEMMCLQLLENLRESRSFFLNQLDSLQMRAFLRGKHEIVSSIESDKQKFRDFTDEIFIENYKCVEDFRGIVPDIFGIDYMEKYEREINS